jgi:hypothetical protein
MAGCGIPQEDYDAVIAERDTAQTKVSSLEGDNAAAKAETDAAEAKLAVALEQTETLEKQAETLQNSLTSAENELATFQADIEAAWEPVEKKSRVAVAFVGFWAVSAAGDIDGIADWTLLIDEAVKGAGDSELSLAWKNAMDAADAGNDGEFMAFLSSAMTRTVLAVSESIVAFEAKLSP